MDNDECITRAEFKSAILVYAVEQEQAALLERNAVTTLQETVRSVQRHVDTKVKKLIKAFDKAYNPLYREEPSCLIS